MCHVAGVPAGFTTNGNHKDGYTVGAGLEYMFAPNWSAKAEYQYYNFGNTNFTTGPADIAGGAFGTTSTPSRLGVNYRFGWGGPVAASTDGVCVPRYEKAGSPPAFLFAVQATAPGVALRRREK